MFPHLGAAQQNSHSARLSGGVYGDVIRHCKALEKRFRTPSPRLKLSNRLRRYGPIKNDALAILAYYSGGPRVRTWG
jgi:hypothetical protein